MKFKVGDYVECYKTESEYDLWFLIGTKGRVVTLDSDMPDGCDVELDNGFCYKSEELRLVSDK